MGTRFFQVLPFFGCTHQFSWPRKWKDGEYYQVCVRCGAEYLYDWARMERRHRVDRYADPDARKGKRPASSWKPRARRLNLEIPVQFREEGSNQWHGGTICNLSKTGVLIVAERILPENAAVELKFVMPKEICGQHGSLVLTSGIIPRVVSAHDGKGGRMAATIQVCRFLMQ
jgi:hypothetical protein